MKCTTCDGEGRTDSNPDVSERAPWSFWTSLPPGQDLAVRLGMVKAMDCTECEGKGTYPEAPALTAASLSPDDLANIQARADRVAEWRKAFHAPQNSLDYSQRDVPALLALVQGQQAAIERVEALAEKWRYKGEFGWGAWQEGHGPDPEGAALDHAASEIRAALTATEGA